MASRDQKPQVEIPELLTDPSSTKRKTRSGKVLGVGGILAVADVVMATAEEIIGRGTAADIIDFTEIVTISDEEDYIDVDASEDLTEVNNGENRTTMEDDNRKCVAPVTSSSNAAALPLPQKTQKMKVEENVPQTAAKRSNKKHVAPNASSSSNKKRVAPAESSSTEDDIIISPPENTPKKKAAKVEEKRDGRIRTLTQAIRDRIARALGQRIFLIGRKDTSAEGSLGQEFTVLGSTGNVYKVKIDKHPNCDCPDHMKGNLCKHILFVFLKVLRTPRDSYIICQRALLQHELQEVFSQAPKRNDRVRASAAVRAAYAGGSSEEAAGPSTDKRKAIDEEPCSICFDDFSKSDDSHGKLVWCETGCGHNFHKQCMQMWLGSKHSAAEKTCPLCRTLWSQQGTGGSQAEGEEGYVNLGQLQPGVSTERDTSTYSEWGYSGHYGNRYSRF